jgi:hypothetical protein
VTRDLGKPVVSCVSAITSCESSDASYAEDFGGDLGVRGSVRVLHLLAWRVGKQSFYGRGSNAVVSRAVFLDLDSLTEAANQK